MHFIKFKVMRNYNVEPSATSPYPIRMIDQSNYKDRSPAFNLQCRVKSCVRTSMFQTKHLNQQCDVR